MCVGFRKRLISKKEEVVCEIIPLLDKQTLINIEEKPVKLISKAIIIS